MGEHTHISWCDHTFNPWIGCTQIAPACDGCYAMAMMDGRYHKVKWNGPPVRTSAGYWRQPYKWNRVAYESLDLRDADRWRRPFVFCSSLADVFDNQAEPAWRSDLFELIRNTPFLVWLLLTKRPQNIIKMSIEAGGLPTNAAIGTTTEDQKRVDINVPHLLLAKAALRPTFAFLSCEPLLGPLEFQWALSRNRLDVAAGLQRRGHFSPGLETVSGVDWVITGGETDQGDHKARPSHPGWYRGLRDQCSAAGTAFHHKQNGEWAPHKPMPGGDLGGDVRAGRVTIVHPSGRSDVEISQATGGRSTEPGSRYMIKIGKRRSGRLLDGIEHNARPEVHTA